MGLLLLTALRPKPRTAGKRSHCTTGLSSARRAGALLAAVVLAGAVTLEAGQQPQFGTGVQVVEVYASVTDPRGEPIKGLRREQFTVREDGTAQPIDTFIEGEFPLSLAIAIDRSWSMAGEPLQRARRGARTLLGELRPDDQAMILSVSAQVETVAGLSTDRRAQLDALDGLDPWSTTALHDAVLAAIEQVQAGTGRRALVLVSDGVDRYSKAGADDVLAAARASDVMVYPFVLGRTRPPLMAELAAVTGGRSFLVRDARALDEAMRAIARELRMQYLLGYSPARPLGTGEWRSIRVSVDVPGAGVRARDGYVAD
jgi:Ca-activated chloride channel homolog